MWNRIKVVVLLLGIITLFDYLWFVLFDSEMSFTSSMAELGILLVYVFVRYGNIHYPDEEK